tara:strand:+ start:1074 stop:1688 length:615 start_codon:yes stop_codon:yes gene_type:complete
MDCCEDIKEISINDFVNEMPPNFIKSIETYFEMNTINILKEYEELINYTKYYIETDCTKCFLCNKNINYVELKKYIENYKNYKNNKVNENVLGKLINKYMEKIDKKCRTFTYESKINSNVYLQYEYNLCETCFNNSLYYWYITHNNKYPSSRIDGFCFIHKNDSFVPEIKSNESLEKIRKIKFIKTYVCNYYNNIKNIYNLFID